MKSTELINFSNDEFGNIRMVEVNGQPMFVGNDIATVLGYKNTRDALLKHVDEEDKGVEKIDTLGGAQSMVVINESGVYSLIMRSKIPNAKKFKHWVTSGILPSIRKHGAYMTDNVIEKTLSDPDYLIQLATVLKQEREARMIAEQEAKQKALQLEAQKPAVIFTEAVTSSNNAILIRDLAKLIASNGVSIGQNRLFGWLRENKYINDYNEPYQRYVDMGLFTRIEHLVEVNGSFITRFTTKVTGKGQVYFVNKFVDKGAKC